MPASHQCLCGRTAPWGAVKTRKRILLIEDKTEEIEMILAALDEHNLAGQVALVRNGNEAIDYLLSQGVFSGRRPGNPAVVLLDEQAPPKGGLSFLRKMKAHPWSKRIPVVMLASSAKPDLEASYECGANAYVVKPGGFCQFIEAIKQVGVFWTALNEPPVKLIGPANAPKKAKSRKSRRPLMRSKAL